MMKNEALAKVLAPRVAELEAQRDKVLADVAPLHAKREALLVQIQPLEAELREVNAAIKQAEQPALRDVGNELAAIARALGAKTLVNPNG
jgi:chaperonin cofactor prefoldin